MSPLLPPRKPVAVASAAQRLINTGNIDSLAPRGRQRLGRAMDSIQTEARNDISFINGGVERNGQEGADTCLALAELEATTGALATGLFAFLDARVAGQKTQFAQEGR